MDYEKLHKDTIAKLQEMVNSGKITVETACGICADFVPENEDEVMIKFIKNQLFNIKKTITENYELDAKLTKAIDWLEKQGEHANFLSKIQVGDKVTRNEDGMLVNLSQLNRVAKKNEKQGKNNMGISEATKKKLEDKLNKALEKETPESWNKFLDEQGEQKPADNVESKFKVGDWVVWDNKILCHVDNIYQGKNSLMYTITDTNNMTRSYSVKGFDNNAHLWTIQDARDGDILCSNQIIVLFKQWEDNTGYTFVIAHAGIDISGKLQITNGHWLINNKSKPATKEQRDILFQKILEAGYEWDAEKKELKKIEQKPDCGKKVDLEKEIQMFSMDLAMKENNGDWEKDIAVTAKHFFELGLKAQKGE